MDRWIDADRVCRLCRQIALCALHVVQRCVARCAPSTLVCGLVCARVRANVPKRAFHALTERRRPSPARRRCAHEGMATRACTANARACMLHVVISWVAGLGMAGRVRVAGGGGGGGRGGCGHHCLFRAIVARTDVEIAYPPDPTDRQQHVEPAELGQ